MKRLFSHSVLVQVTNLIIKAWITMLYTLFAGGFAFALFQVITNPEQFSGFGGIIK